MRHDGGLEWGVWSRYMWGIVGSEMYIEILPNNIFWVWMGEKGSQLDSKISSLSNYKSERYYIITHFNHTHTLQLCISKGIFFPYCLIIFNIFIKYSVIIKVPRKLRVKFVKCRMLWILIFMLLCTIILLSTIFHLD